MTVSIAENWSDITGSIRQVRISGRMKGFYELEVLVETVHLVPGFRNLLEGMQGRVQVLMVPEYLVLEQHPGPGDQVQCRVRVASRQRIVIHPEHFRIRSATGELPS